MLLISHVIASISAFRLGEDFFGAYWVHSEISCILCHLCIFQRAVVAS